MKKLLTIMLAAHAVLAFGQTTLHYSPSGYTILSTGHKQYGNVGFTAVSDDLPLIIACSTTGNPITNIWDLTTAVDDFSSLRSLTMTIEGRHGYFGSPVSLYVQNMETGAFDLLGQPWWGLTDVVTQATTSSDPARYVSPGGIVRMRLHSAYTSQNVHCVDMARVTVVDDPFARGNRTHYRPSSVLMLKGQWLSGYFGTDLTRVDGSYLKAIPSGTTLDWQADMTGVSLASTLKRFEVTLSTSSTRTNYCSASIYNWVQRKWITLAGIKNYDQENYRFPVTNLTTARECVSQGRIRVRFTNTSSAGMNVDMLKLTTVQ